jgi:hypothetical protein
MHFLSVATTLFFLICLQHILISPALAANCPADQQFDDGLLTCTKTATNNYTLTEADIEESPDTSPLKLAFAKCMCTASAWNTFQNVKTTCMFTAAQTAEDVNEFIEYCGLINVPFNANTGPANVGGGVGNAAGLNHGTTGNANSGAANAIVIESLAISLVSILYILVL